MTENTDVKFAAVEATGDIRGLKLNGVVADEVQEAIDDIDDIIASPASPPSLLEGDFQETTEEPVEEVNKVVEERRKALLENLIKRKAALKEEVVPVEDKPLPTTAASNVDIAEPHRREGLHVGGPRQGRGVKQGPNKDDSNHRRGVFKAFPNKKTNNVGYGTNISDVQRNRQK